MFRITLILVAAVLAHVALTSTLRAAQPTSSRSECKICLIGLDPITGARIWVCADADAGALSCTIPSDHSSCTNVGICS